MRIVTILLVLFVQNINAQSKKENLLSKIYFPFTCGILLTSNNELNSGWRGQAPAFAILSAAYRA